MLGFNEKRFKAGRIEKFEEKVAKDFDLNEEWESAEKIL